MYDFDNEEKKSIRKKIKSLLLHIKKNTKKDLRDLIR